MNSAGRRTSRFEIRAAAWDFGIEDTTITRDARASCANGEENRTPS